MRKNHRLWLIDMGDGSWACSCEACGLLCRDSESIAESAGELHLLLVRESVGTVTGA
jgi:hypothetical protein